MKKTLKVVFFIFIALIVWLLIGEFRFPQRSIDWLCDKCSPQGLVLSCSDIRFSLRRGVEIREVRLFDPTCKQPELPIIAADAVYVRPLLREVTVYGAKLPRLQDSYYEPGINTEPIPDKVLDAVRFPRLGTFYLELYHPNILGIEPIMLSTKVNILERRIDFSKLHIQWPDIDQPMSLEGYCIIDMPSRRVLGSVEGAATQSHIRPLLVALDIPISLPYMDAFTGVVGPVPAFCGWDVNIQRGDFDLKLDLHPDMGKYNGVSLKHIDGKIAIAVRFADGFKNYRTQVGPLKATDCWGRTLEGTIAFVGSNGVDRVEFDAGSALVKADTLNIIGYLNDGILDCLECKAPPTVSVKGVIFPDDAYTSLNDLAGNLKIADTTLFGFALTNAVGKFTYCGTTISYNDCRANTPSGGEILGRAQMHPSVEADKDGDYAVELELKDVTLEELANGFGVDPCDRNGKISGRICLNGAIATNALDKLCGEGKFNLDDGYLARMPLFVGLTDLLAEEVPGVGSVVNLSKASADITIRNGVISTENFYIDGGIFSVIIWGTADLVHNQLDCTARVQFSKSDSILSTVLHPVLWPFTKLLLEFKATGAVDSPKWEYISIIDRVF